MLSLSVNLILLPPRGWAHLQLKSARGDALPRPLMHASAIAACSIGALLSSAVAAADATVGRATIATLVASNAYLGAAVLATRVAPKLGGRNDAALKARHASAAALPVLGSGVLVALLPQVSPLLPTLAASALTALSSYWGAKTLLNLSGGARLTTAAQVAALACVAPLTVALLRDL